MPILPTKLKPGEVFAKTGDILGADDLPEATIRPTGWKRGKKTLVMQVKGLSLWQREQILKECTDREGKIDVVAQVEAVFREGVTVPKFSLAEASQLRHKNPVLLEEIANFIWTLSTLDQGFIDDIVQRLADAEAPPADEPSPVDPDGDTARPVVEAPIRKVRRTTRPTRPGPQRAA